MPRLHSSQEVIKLEGSSVPPVSFGTIWSTRNLTPSWWGVFPQYRQRKPSRAKIEKRVLSQGFLYSFWRSICCCRPAALRHSSEQYLDQPRVVVNSLWHHTHLIVLSGFFLNIASLAVRQAGQNLTRARLVSKGSLQNAQNLSISLLICIINAFIITCQGKPDPYYSEGLNRGTFI